MTEMKSFAQLDGIWHDVEATVEGAVLTKDGWRVLMVDVYVDGGPFRDHMYSVITIELAKLRPERKSNISFKAQITSYTRRNGSSGLCFDRMKEFRRIYF